MLLFLGIHGVRVLLLPTQGQVTVRTMASVLIRTLGLEATVRRAVAKQDADVLGLVGVGAVQGVNLALGGDRAVRDSTALAAARFYFGARIVSMRRMAVVCRRCTSGWTQ
ncbi:hypothetical protein [Streptomyces sp. NRRL S-241]|uniref:hypothetical protein n=1 Tax=Streptomyces sp. NRRL S-241 TaxID=1463896 RepID=UPI0004C087D0|nr:hypothetical protein [Streptomyces sp. NRRL S-241]